MCRVVLYAPYAATDGSFSMANVWRHVQMTWPVQGSRCFDVGVLNRMCAVVGKYMMVRLMERLRKLSRTAALRTAADVQLRETRPVEIVLLVSILQVAMAANASAVLVVSICIKTLASIPALLAQLVSAKMRVVGGLRIMGENVCST